MGRLEGKVALISGGARGQGETEARLFVAEGARVVLGDVRDEAGEKVAAELGDKAVYLHLDVTQESHWQAAVQRASDEFGRLDVLVNNAGIFMQDRLEDMSADDYMRVVRVNQLGVFLGMKSAAPAMRASGGGSIVNISSNAGLEGISHVIAYVSSKWAVRGMTKTAAIELAPAGIRVNSVHPGAVATPMILGDAVQGTDADEVISTAPLKRMAEPLEIAKLVLFLASDESSYSTGSEFVADGGMTAGHAIAPLD
ncbi:MAG: glucose 1-dehydrogenase [Proteobacteria bacterium]|nr:glucose 1-dehydrogenase [Pseudomonadota bacterium]